MTPGRGFGTCREERLREGKRGVGLIEAQARVAEPSHRFGQQGNGSLWWGRYRVSGRCRGHQRRDVSRLCRLAKFGRQQPRCILLVSGVHEDYREVEHVRTE